MVDRFGLIAAYGLIAAHELIAIIRCVLDRASLNVGSGRAGTSGVLPLRRQARSAVRA
jgi:hypothetical protein